VAARRGEIPYGAVRAGMDGCNEVFVARAYHESGVQPGKIVAGQDVAYISFGGLEHAKTIYQVRKKPTTACCVKQYRRHNIEFIAHSR